MIIINTVCLGDSLTFGYGGYPKNSWVSLVHNRLGITMLNKGINGDTTAGMLDRLFEDVIEHKCSNVLIMGGTNDFISNRSTASAFENIVIMIKECIFEHISPIILSPPPIISKLARKTWADGVDYDEVNKKLSHFSFLLLKYCNQNDIKFINLYEAFSHITEDAIDSYFTDGVHLSIKGNIFVADLIIKENLFIHK